MIAVAVVADGGRQVLLLVEVVGVDAGFVVLELVGRQSIGRHVRFIRVTAAACLGNVPGKGRGLGILGRLDASNRPLDMELHGLSLHPLKGRRKGFWAVRVSGNWRVTFSFRDKDAVLVDYEDYHWEFCDACA